MKLTAIDKQVLAHKMLCTSSVLTFTRKMYEYMNHTPYLVGDHHRRICEELDAVVRGDTRKLIINIAPRYGKTLLVSQMFIAYGLAINPNAKFLHLSYSGALTQDNSMAVKDIVNSEYYQALFNTRIMRGRDTRSRWSTEQGGGEYATSTLGQITGFGAGQVEKDEEQAFDEFTARFNPDRFAGAIVIDDPIKPDDAYSDYVRENVNRRFETTIRNRVNSRKTPIIIIMQRLHEHDLCGYLQEIEPDDWRVVSLPAISLIDGVEKPLWPFKHSIEELHKIQKANAVVFETQYMQNPTPLEGLMYRDFKEYDVIPYNQKARRVNYTDFADTGSDWFCSISAVCNPDAYYVTDVVYTKKPAEYTEQVLATTLAREETEVCYGEANNGGRITMRNVERISREMGNAKTRFIAFSQTKNKQVRIFTRAGEVCNMVVFPRGWDRRWPDFYHDMKAYRKEGRNAHDDAPDAMTGLIEKCEEYKKTILSTQLLRDFL